MGSAEDNILYKSTINTLYKKFKWKCEFICDEGQHTIFVVFDPDRKRKMRVKISPSTSVKRTEEIVEWPNLFHPNILPLYNIFRYDQRIRIFLMPYTESTMAEQLHPERTRNLFGGFLTVKKWLYQILSALDYLHVRNLHHLNLNLENQLITDRGNIRLSDFEHLNSKNKIIKIDEVGMKTVYRPPELCWYEENQIGKKEFVASHLDLWAYGIISLQAITAQKLNLDPIRWQCNSHLSNWRLWKIEVGDTLNLITRKPAYFQYILQSSYPTTIFTKRDIRNCYAFLYSFLREDPENRLPVKYAIKHNFLSPYNRERLSTPTCELTLEDKLGKTASLSCLQITYPIIENESKKNIEIPGKAKIKKIKRVESCPNSLEYFVKPNKNISI
ncbi:cyclin-dependent kinase 17-like [Centruroides sculpturatus]|uniref:cyclin-dependent kinase 17-like n=1 Tax=Centruroides sculpturatus TaxID=218467 RepID=UPI000C6E3C0B|nr:cyclin-dependent kinase 17-like [Centruroides sculpturatus]